MGSTCKGWGREGTSRSQWNGWCGGAPLDPGVCAKLLLQTPLKEHTRYLVLMESGTSPWGPISGRSGRSRPLSAWLSLHTGDGEALAQGPHQQHRQGSVGQLWT